MLYDTSLVRHSPCACYIRFEFRLLFWLLTTPPKYDNIMSQGTVARAYGRLLQISNGTAARLCTPGGYFFLYPRIPKTTEDSRESKAITSITVILSPPFGGAAPPLRQHYNITGIALCQYFSQTFSKIFQAVCFRRFSFCLAVIQTVNNNTCLTLDKIQIV